MARRDQERPDSSGTQQNERTIAFSSLIESGEKAVEAKSDTSPSLAGASASEIVAKLCAGDPLWIRAGCDARMRARCVMVFLPRLEAKVIAHVAHAAALARVDAADARWLAERVDAAIDDVLDEDREGMLDPQDFEFAARVWRVDADSARRGVSAFNDLPRDVRAAYWAVVIDRKGVRRCASDLGVSRPEIEKRVKRAVLAITTLGASERRGPARGGSDGG